MCPVCRTRGVALIPDQGIHFRCRVCGWTHPDSESAALERAADTDRAEANWEHENYLQGG